jgi:hypothetical protein
LKRAIAPHRLLGYDLCFTMPEHLTMYEDFTAKDGWTGEPVHCLYQSLILAIATRHADAVDIKFLASGHPVWIALPHPAWGEYTRRTGRVITDPLAVQIAGHYLKQAIESGENGGREMHMLTIEETLAQLDAVLRASA